ncbi:MAG: ABC transporter permease [Anaerolineae bacterium]
MKNNIYKREFKTRRRSVITWSVSAAAVALLYFSIFPSFAKDAALINKTMESFPPEFRAAFGMGDVDFSTIMGFFSFVYFFLQIMLAIQAANYGFGLVSIEERELTADFLMTKPVARVQIMNSKLLAALTSLGVTQVVVWVSVFVFVNAFKGDGTYDAGTLALMLLGLSVFQLFFLTVGLVVSLLVKRVRSVTPYAMGLGFGMYVLGAFGDLGGATTFELIPPFMNFDPKFMIKNGRFDTPLVLISIVVIIVSSAASYWLYLRRDISSVT